MTRLFDNLHALASKLVRISKLPNFRIPPEPANIGFHLYIHRGGALTRQRTRHHWVVATFLLQEKELERWKLHVKELESENFIKEQTIRQLQEQPEVILLKNYPRVNSHHLSAWQSINIVRRNYMSITWEPFLWTHHGWRPSQVFKKCF